MGGVRWAWAARKCLCRRDAIPRQAMSYSMPASVARLSGMQGRVKANISMSAVRTASEAPPTLQPLVSAETGRSPLQERGHLWLGSILRHCRSPHAGGPKLLFLSFRSPALIASSSIQHTAAKDTRFARDPAAGTQCSLAHALLFACYTASQNDASPSPFGVSR